MRMLVVIFLVAIGLPNLVFADCTSPAGKEGQFQYIDPTFKFCDGSYWITVGYNNATGIVCAGEEGKVRYRLGDIEVCSKFKADPAEWRGTKNANLGSCAGTAAGTWGYNPATRDPRFCDGTNWYRMRSNRGIMFSTTLVNSWFGGLAAGDAICQADAIAASYSGTWVAWLSTDSVDAKDRILDNGPWYNNAVMSGKVADDKASLLDGTLDSPINTAFDGTTITTASYAYTGTTEAGVKSTGNNCSGWTTGGGRTPPPVMRGNGGRTDSRWTNIDIGGCSPSYRLICFEL